VAQAGSLVNARGLAPQAPDDLMGVTRPDAAGVCGGLHRTTRLSATDLYRLNPPYGIQSDFELAVLEADGSVTGTPVTTRLAK
jgi:hypothetical protein